MFLNHSLGVGDSGSNRSAIARALWRTLVSRDCGGRLRGNLKFDDVFVISPEKIVVREFD
jgi:hypothetical protein